MQALSIVPDIFMCPVVVLLGFMHQIVIAVHCLVGFASRRAGASVLVKIGVAVGLACVMFGFAELAVGTASAVGCFASVFLRLASVPFEASVMMPLVSRAWMGVMRRGGWVDPDAGRGACDRGRCDAPCRGLYRVFYCVYCRVSCQMMLMPAFASWR